MTQSERQLTTTLQRLSDQYAQEQQRQTRQVATSQQRIEVCREQVEQLAEHATRLDTDDRTLAACSV